MQDCIAHAFAEGLTKVTLMYKTKAPNLPEPYDLSLCHSLYTADDITPTQQAWAAWAHHGKEHPPMPPTRQRSRRTSGDLDWHEKRYPENPDPPEIAFVRPLYPPDAVEKDMTPSSRGPDVKAIKRAISHAQRFLPWSPEEWDDIYDDVIAHGDGSGVDRSGVAGFQQQMGIEPTGWVGKATFEALRTSLVPNKPGTPHAAKPLFDSECISLLEVAAEQVAESPPESKPALPDLGPVVAGGKSVLDHDLTHATGGLDGYAAFDDGWRAGLAVVAPEALTVTRLSSARRRDGDPNGRAFYATGASKIRYWFGHVDDPPAVGARFKKGQKLAVISANHEEPHLHVGVDASALIGRELEHHTDYTHGAPTVGAQLSRT